jgi:hypothetical protein
MFKDKTDEMIDHFQQKKDEFLNESNVTRKSKLKEEIDVLLIEIFESKLKNQKADYFNRLKEIENKHSKWPTQKQRDEYIIQDKEKLYKEFGFDLESAENQLKEFTSGRMIKPFFLWNLYFSEIFHNKGGFDVVIANPPYVRADSGPESFIFKVFDVMKQASWHQFQILTKRSARLRELAQELDWPENVWIGVSVENEEVKFRIDDFRDVPAAIRFLSLEPLLDPLGPLDLSNIDWVIVGGESGPGARQMEKEWVLQIKEQCIEQNTPFYFKQWGGVHKKKTGRILLNKTWDEMPVYVML